MYVAQRKAAGRSGFTLVELLVVIAIIVILVGLVSAAVFRAIVKADEVNTRQEISQLSQAMAAFQAKFGGITPPPSRFVLRENLNNYDLNNPNPVIRKLEADSLSYLRRLWPRLQTLSDWNNDGNANGFWNFEGHECLVFFLGGKPAVVNGVPVLPLGCTGFSTSKSNPAQDGGDRIPPFFEFQSGRLVFGANPPFFAYLDAYGKSNGQGGAVSNSKPYAYFSSYRTPNGYNPYGGTDCPTLLTSPCYLSAAPTFRYHNPEKFQIISAGVNKVFGVGGPWTGTAGGVYPANNPGFDDLSNFHDGQMGVPR